MELKLDIKRIEENKRKRRELSEGNRKILVNAHWNDPKAPPCSQLDEYNDHPNLEPSRIAGLNRAMEAASESFDNVPVTTFFGATAYMMSSAYGCPIRSQGDLIITTPKYKLGDTDIIPPPYPEEQGLYPKAFAYLARFMEKYPEAPCSVVDNQSPIDVFHLLYSVEDAMYMFFDYPEESKRILDGITENIIRVNRKLESRIKNFAGFASGIYTAKGIKLSDDDAAFLSPEIYREFARPCMDRLSREFGGIEFHVCLKFEQNIENLTATEGFMGFDCQPYYNDPLMALKHLDPCHIWNLFNWPWTVPANCGEPVFDFFRRMLDLTREKTRVIVDVYQPEKKDALTLAGKVRRYARETGWE